MEKVIDGIIYSEDMSEVLGVESKSIKIARVAEGVKIIRSEAFKDCTELTEVYLPSSIERIWYQVWKNCNSLLTIHFGSDFVRLVTKWFNFLSAQVEFDCEKDSKTYKLIKRSSVLRSHIKELSMMSAKSANCKPKIWDNRACRAKKVLRHFQFWSGLRKVAFKNPDDYPNLF